MSASKPQTHPLIGDVSATSFWVAYYRARESARPDALFHDRFAEALMGDLGKRISDSMAEMSRYTEWSVISRTVIIDRFIERSVREGVDAVINLGAGLDARPYRMNLPENLKWVEVDYAHIIAHKNKVLSHEKPNCQLTRVACDLAVRENRSALFNQLVPEAKKVLILTEGVIIYLSQEQVAELAQDLHAHPRFHFWVTEYFHKRVYRYLKSAVRQLQLTQAPFKFYPDHWFGFFEAQGWVESETRFSREIAVEFSRKPPMPKWTEFVLPLLPKRIRDEALRMAGFVIFRRAA